MSKQAAATKIYNELIATHNDRKDIIAEIVGRVGVSSAYAATLYNNARKSAAPAASVVTTSKPAATSTSGISSFDKSNLKTIRRDLSAALELVEKKHGVKFDQGNIRFSGSNFRMRLECNVNTAPGVDGEKVKWDNNCFLFGLKPEHYGSTFRSGRDTFTVVGINPRAKKNAIIGRNDRGTEYIFPAHVLSS